MMFNGQNALIAYLEFDNSEKIASQTAPISNGSKAILQLMKDPELNIQLAISTGLTCPIRELWSNLTKTTTRRGFSDKIGELNADAIQGRDLFLESYGQNVDILLKKHL